MLVRPIADANNIGLKTASFAIDNIDYVNTKINDFLEGRNFLYNKFIENGIKTLKSDGNFLLIGCNSMESAKKALEYLRKKKYLLKGPYSNYPLENYIRVSIGPLSLMEKFWSECSDILMKSSS